MRPHKQARLMEPGAGSSLYAAVPSTRLFPSNFCSENTQTLQECAESILEDLEASRSLLSGMFRTFLRDANIQPVPKHHDSTLRARDTEMLLTVTLEDLYSGTVKSVPVQRTKHDGRGHVMPVQEQLQVHVQPGLKAGTRITLPGQGNEDCYGMAADLTFVVQQQLHPAFRRLRDDLYAIVKVPLVTALTGGPVSLRTLSGQLLQLPISDIITPGSELVLPNQGMPVFGDQEGRRGALHVKFHVQFPQQLSQQQQLQLRTALAGCDEVFAHKSSAGLSALPRNSQHQYRHQQDESHSSGLQDGMEACAMWCANDRFHHLQQQQQQQGQCMLGDAFSSSPSGASSHGSDVFLPNGSSSLWSAAVSSSAVGCSSVAGFACTGSTSSSREPGCHHQT